jgi:hypothetical protein
MSPRILEPNVLIVSSNKHISRNIGKYYSNLGAMVMIAVINLQDHQLVIENLNEKGIKYASITREVCDGDEAREILYHYLNDCSKFSLVINLAGEDEAVTSILTDTLDPQGGILCTAV